MTVRVSASFLKQGSKMRNRPVWECTICGRTVTAKPKAPCTICSRKMEGGIDWIYHQSQKEFKRWRELQTLEKAGQIRGLRRQVKFTFEINGQKIKTPKGRDLAAWWDFVYFEPLGGTTDQGRWFAGGVQVVEDAKGRKAGAAYDLFWLKRELMRLVQGIEVREI